MSITYFLKNRSKRRCNLVFDSEVVFHCCKVPSSRIIGGGVQVDLPNERDERLISITQVSYVGIITISSASKDSTGGARCTLQLMSAEGWAIHPNIYILNNLIAHIKIK
jgi:hypothetical protein